RCPSGIPCFLPGNLVTRGQIAKMVSGSAGYSDNIPPSQQTFADTPPSSPFWLWVERVYIHGVISGYPGNGSIINPCTGLVEQVGTLYFRWCSYTTRGQTTKFIANAFFPACQTPQEATKPANK